MSSRRSKNSVQPKDQWIKVILTQQPVTHRACTRRAAQGLLDRIPPPSSPPTLACTHPHERDRCTCIGRLESSNSWSDCQGGLDHCQAFRGCNLLNFCIRFASNFWSIPIQINNLQAIFSRRLEIFVFAAWVKRSSQVTPKGPHPCQKQPPPKPNQTNNPQPPTPNQQKHHPHHPHKHTRTCRKIFSVFRRRDLPPIRNRWCPPRLRQGSKPPPS